MNKRPEQSSGSTAEEILPKVLAHVEHCINLTSISDDVTKNVKCFYSPDDSVFVGILLQETEDSFLVGASAKLVIDNNRNITAKMLSAKPVMRFLKTSLKYLVEPTDLTLYHYFAFLQQFGYNQLPDYFTDAYKEVIESVRASSAYNRLMDLSEPAETKPEIPGDSEFSFIPHTQSESIH